MLNVMTGEVSIESFAVFLSPSFKRDDLSKLPITSKSQVVNEPFHSYSLGKQVLGGKPFYVLLFFMGKNSNLLSCRLSQTSSVISGMIGRQSRRQSEKKHTTVGLSGRQAMPRMCMHGEKLTRLMIQNQVEVR